MLTQSHMLGELLAACAELVVVLSAAPEGMEGADMSCSLPIAPISVGTSSTCYGDGHLRSPAKGSSGLRVCIERRSTKERWSVKWVRELGVVSLEKG